MVRIARQINHYEGFTLSVDNDGVTETIALINGNNETYSGTIILLSLDAHIVYGMSHPTVISRIIYHGPQPLVTTKEIGHNLFEHGMKAALGRMKLGMNPVTTTLDTFYNMTEVGHLKMLSNNACMVRIANYAQFIIATNDYKPLMNSEKVVYIDKIRDFVTV